MSPKVASELLAMYVCTFLPMYGMERLANYFYLSHDPTFFLISGWRLEVFILSCLVGSFAAGALLRNFRLALVSQWTALGTLLILVYVGCDPRVCFSTAPDGFEPARVGFFLGSVVVSASSLGISSRRAMTGRKWESILVWGASFAAVGWYPIIFTFAGTSLLAPFSPWGVLTVLFILGFATAHRARNTLTRKAALLVPVGSLLLSFAISFGIGVGYLGSFAGLLGLMTVSTIMGAAAGSLLPLNRGNSPRLSESSASVGFGVSIVLVLLMTLVVIPDAVSGVVPQSSTPGGTFVVGSPVYAGAYMNSPQGHALGAGVNVSLFDVSANAIANDNYMAAGIAVHSANCCVDGIDFAYRFDVYIFHGSKAALLATAWEACDDVIACGGHSWKVLMYSKSAPLGVNSSNTNLGLRMMWSNGSMNWTFAEGGGEFVKFANFFPPAQENQAFNTGISTGISFSSQKEAYFYQFGLMSRYPIEQPGWSVMFQCPSVYVNGGWQCIHHAGTLVGRNSYWKVIWRWGEDYPGISITTAGKDSAMFRYDATNATPDQSQLW